MENITIDLKINTTEEPKRQNLSHQEISKDKEVATPIKPKKNHTPKQMRERAAIRLKVYTGSSLKNKYFKEISKKSVIKNKQIIKMNVDIK